MAKKTETAPSKKQSAAFSDDELAAMKERAEEVKAEKRRRSGSKKVDGESDLLAKIAEMPEPERAMASRLHEIIKASAPELTSKTWYGMPAYANQDGKIVCFFQSAQKFGARYATLGFNDAARLDDGDLFPVAYALIDLTPAVEAKIAALMKQAVS